MPETSSIPLALTPGDKIVIDFKNESKVNGYLALVPFISTGVALTTTMPIFLSLFPIQLAALLTTINNRNYIKRILKLPLSDDEHSKINSRLHLSTFNMVVIGIGFLFTLVVFDQFYHRFSDLVFDNSFRWFSYMFWGGEYYTIGELREMYSKEDKERRKMRALKRASLREDMIREVSKDI